MSHADLRSSAAPAAGASSRAVSIVAAFLFGVIIIGGTGFAQMAVAHNAAHDHRHSIGFPCH
ncbi:CbtB domain-containing protein [Methylopila turkensis]|uniref:Cobalt transporter subunit CbtB n=1 Tax=Methylopila turkensis TaxID=1437816 RepID=A0A9W6JS94_9HYPH|nr:CbtB domain-containing protein [Methylopila turkensis]GLK81125.1 cobalt transporter subunit CbtB [Methylopila turkensis]